VLETSKMKNSIEFWIRN